MSVETKLYVMKEINAELVDVQDTVKSVSRIIAMRFVTNLLLSQIVNI